MNPSGKGYGHGQKKESSEWSGELIVTIATSNNPDKSGVLSNEPAIRTAQATAHWDNDSDDVSLWLGTSEDLSRAS